jgi:hypothetical protein
LGVGKGVIGTIGGGKAKPTGKIDIAVMQSLSRQGEVITGRELRPGDRGRVPPRRRVSFDAILKRTKAKYVLGLTATPIRRDGQQPIIFMQCGPIRYTAAKPAGAPHDLEVMPRSPSIAQSICRRAGIQDVFRHLANDQARTDAIADEVKTCLRAGPQGARADRAYRTPRRWIKAAWTACRRAIRACTAACPGSNGPRCGGTGSPAARCAARLAGHRQAGRRRLRSPAARYLVLAMPISWKGTLQQYAGRLHREHASKTDVRIIDFVDTGHPALLRMWDKRQRGYRAMGYAVHRTIRVKHFHNGHSALQELRLEVIWLTRIQGDGKHVM